MAGLTNHTVADDPAKLFHMGLHTCTKQNTVDQGAVQRSARNCFLLPSGGANVIGGGSGCVTFDTTSLPPPPRDLSPSPRLQSST